MSEPGPEEREEQLVKLRRRMSRALRRGETAEYERLAAEYAAAKAEHSAASDAEMKSAMRAQRALERAQEAAVAPQRWRLPAGFGTSPLAAQRAREGWSERREPSAPAGGLRPWRRGSLMETRVWRPPS